MQVQACGVCHTDLHYRDGSIDDDFRFLLSHEAAGVVEAMGPDVTGVSPPHTTPGDFVVLNWRAVCAECGACKQGDLQYCFNTHNAKQKMTLAEGPDAGTELSPALGIGAFAEKTLVAAGQCTKVDLSARPAAAGLLGCGVMAASGRPSTPARSPVASLWRSSAAVVWAWRRSLARRSPARRRSSRSTSTPRSSRRRRR